MNKSATVENNLLLEAYWSIMYVNSFIQDKLENYFILTN